MCWRMHMGSHPYIGCYLFPAKSGSYFREWTECRYTIKFLFSKHLVQYSFETQRQLTKHVDLSHVLSHHVNHMWILLAAHFTNIALCVRRAGNEPSQTPPFPAHLKKYWYLQAGPTLAYFLSPNNRVYTRLRLFIRYFRHVLDSLHFFVIIASDGHCLVHIY